MAEKVAFKRIVEVGPEIVLQIDEMLTSGEVPSKIADWLQQEGHFGDLTASSLKKNLERYRDIELPKKAKAALGVKPKQTVGLKKKMSALEEMKGIFEIQKARLNKLLVKEGVLPDGVLLQQATKEVQLTKELLTEIGKLQLETGELRRAPKTVSGMVTDPDGTSRQFTWTEEQDKLFKQLENVDYSVIDSQAALSN